MKTIAFFVPQYHRIPLNDKYWGEGFTEWDNIRKAKPEFEGHAQPRVPLNNNYYNLLERDTKVWQIELAKKYGLYGFCYYHYWFDGEMLLEKPCEQILEDKTLDFPFCFCWANEAWSMLPYVYVTCVETIISVPATIALQPIKAVGRSDLMLKFEIIKKVFFIVSTIVAMNFGVFAIALTVPANTLLDLIINANINKKLINYSFFEELSDCLAALILSLIMAVVVAFIGKIEFNIYIKVVIQIMVGGLCYAGLSYLTRNKEFSYILNVGMKHFKKA